MKTAMKNLGFEKEDLDTRKVLEDFTYSSKVAGQEMTNAEYDQSIVNLWYHHY